VALNQAIEHDKERRWPDHHGKAVDTSCRNHGDRSWCRLNRTRFDRKCKESLVDGLLAGAPAPFPSNRRGNTGKPRGNVEACGVFGGSF
jgi:hypothetical protein